MKVNKKMKKIRIITLLFLFISVITFAILYNGAISKPLKSNEKTVSVKVKAGDGFYDVLNRLDDEGKLHNKLLIKVKLSIDKQNITLKEGTYEINSDVTLEQLIKDLQDDSYNINMIKVTIPEGYSVEEIAELMEEKGLCSKNEFIEAIKNYELPTFVEVNEKRRYNLEGFLYPDTYLIEMGTNANNIIDKMLERFN
ncbi:MAG: endolytic transglycosylase MltG, partial [Clostridium sp.]|nr:endolytic transglycosylase MltG [Clostridium sp.]